MNPACIILTVLPPSASASFRRMMVTMATCFVCNRNFQTKLGFYHHRGTAKAHMFDCRRCLRHFKSPQAQQQHVRDSPNHHVCHQCDDAQDFTTAEKLDQHAINVHNTCSICKRRFDTSSNLRSVCCRPRARRLHLVF